MSDTEETPLIVRKRGFHAKDETPAQSNIREMTEWLKELLHKRNTEGIRVVSPQTESKIKQLMAAYERADFSAVGDEEMQATNSTINMLRDEIARRIDTDEKYAQAKSRLNKLTSDKFFIQYGDYFSQTCNFLRQNLLASRKAAKNRLKRQMRKDRKREEMGKTNEPSQQNQDKPQHVAQPGTTTEGRSSPPPQPSSSPPPVDDEIENAAKMFISATWAEISKELDMEGKVLSDWNLKRNSGKDDPPPQTPMISLLHRLTEEQSFVAYFEACDSISYYAERNKIAHSHIAIMLKEERMVEALARIENDLRDLENVTCIDESVRTATEKAIFTTARLFFREFKVDKDTKKVRSISSWPKDKQGNYIRKEGESQVGYVDSDDDESDDSDYHSDSNDP
ncbi:hypothetical protein F5B19DRAFT_437233 [Rostrohypoxylon terebratum]|nr:hypothetical protein F5B19DRAFT_437233 [Rostrohypoxylon terebratum]